MISIASVNAYNLYSDPADDERSRRLEDLIRDVDADIIAVQEIIADGASPHEKRPGAVAGLERLATAVDRSYLVAPLPPAVEPDPAVAVGGIIHHAGLLWRTGITAMPGSLHTLTREGAGMWHCAVSVVFILGGRRVRIGSVQLSPFDLTWSTMDVSQIMRVFNSGDVPGLIGGDWNCIGSDPDYDPDPYHDVAWHPDHAYQLTESGEVDRRPARRLEAPHLGRMRDCARLAGVDWAATTGHHHTDHHPPRRIDRWYATRHLPEKAIVGYTVIDLATVGDTTDHLPIVVHLDEAALGSRIL